MNKPTLITAGLLLIAISCFGQSTPVSDVLDKLGEMDDQFDNRYDSKAIEDQLVVIYVPGTNNPFQMVYNKKKGAKMVDGTLLVGGFKEMMNSMSYETKKEHLQEALSARYKNGSQVLIDMDSELEAMLPIQGYSIITISRKENKVIKSAYFEFDRVAFFKALGAYEKE